MNKKELMRQREIEHWERERARPKKNGYFAWLVFVICLIYATDEIASQIGPLMKTEIANDLFASFGESSAIWKNELKMYPKPHRMSGTNHAIIAAMRSVSLIVRESSSLSLSPLQSTI